MPSLMLAAHLAVATLVAAPIDARNPGQSIAKPTIDSTLTTRLSCSVATASPCAGRKAFA